MNSLDPIAARRFALETVETLHGAGYQALWAGGCVRDELLGHAPKDYDVATSATPEQVREVFGRRRTLAIGAAFGVITVIGSRTSGNVEVATFRRDAGYSDGRHPDSVSFSTAQHDAARRDFTINGLFYDPLQEQVIDYVEGQHDLRQGVIRAIGNPHERFEEDKLRILRAIRFAAVFDFVIDRQTMAAIEQNASELVIVSAERIAAELRKMLLHPNRRRAVELLAQAQLLSVIFPEAHDLLPDSPHSLDNAHDNWLAMLTTLEHLSASSFPLALALLLRWMCPKAAAAKRFVREIGSRLKLSNEELGLAAWLCEQQPALAEATERPWPEIQRLLIQAEASHAPAYLSALAAIDPRYSQAAEFCKRKLALPAEQLNPEPLVTGADLIRLGMRPGPRFKQILAEIRDQQLAGTIESVAEALELVNRMSRS